MFTQIEIQDDNGTFATFEIADFEDSHDAVVGAIEYLHCWFEDEGEDIYSEEDCEQALKELDIFKNGINDIEFTAEYGSGMLIDVIFGFEFIII